MTISDHYPLMMFSILIANYNNGRFFTDCYHSIISQTYTDWEAIIVDDGSTDNSLEIIESLTRGDKRFKIFTNQENRGCGYTKRKTLEFASGEICGFLDPDDALEENALELSVKQYHENNIVATYSKITFCDPKLKPVSDFKKIQPILNDQYFFNLPIQIHHFFTFRKNIYDKTVGINPDLKSAVDQDLYLKILEQGDVSFIPVNLYLYRRHAEGISQHSSKIKAKNNFAKVIWETFKRRGITEINGRKIPETYHNAQEIFDLLNYQNEIPFRLIKKLKMLFQKFS